jgi:aspartyl-tRNA synthetase
LISAAPTTAAACAPATLGAKSSSSAGSTATASSAAGSSSPSATALGSPSSPSAPTSTPRPRLRYRYLDLRRPVLQRNFILRSRLATLTRQTLAEEGFLELETPYMVKYTPGGARNFLVPSRLNPGRFYALPQSPQIFKQILMVAGMDRYFQIVKCFRDEDLRADRQPEFTQIDIEISFPTEDTVMEVAEGVLRAMFTEIRGLTIAEIPRITYAEAIDRYGIDSPDTRFGMHLKTLTDLVVGSASTVISGGLANGGVCRGMNVKGHAEAASNKVLNGYTDFVKRYGMGGLLWGKVGAEGLTGSLAKLLSAEEAAAVVSALGGSAGRPAARRRRRPQRREPGLGRLRAQLGRDLSLHQHEFSFCWVNDFPAFDWDKDSQRWVAMHHPFTSPQG